MLKNILNLEGVSLLNKEEQKNVNGGRTNLGYCNARRWVINSSGTLVSQVMIMNSYANSVAYAASGSGGQGDVCCTVEGCANSPWA
ncbi:hypothetical protein [Flavobacterium sp.]|jgi:hypothetical protein|uniref:hypothetical protein n=1 Tax=Flavobacterium sp. TaxID=239 RepID=UPI0037BFABA2